MTDDVQLRVFHFNDVKQLYKKKSKALFQIAIVGGLLAGLVIFARGPKYKIEASFKESKDRDSNEDLLKNLFTVSSSKDSSEISSYMRSNAVLRPLIENIGLQAVVTQASFPQKLTRRFWETLQAEWGSPLSDMDTFAFKQVRYEGEIPFSLGLYFIDKTHFEVRDGKQVVFSGAVGEAVQYKNISFTLTGVPQTLALRKVYPLRIEPWTNRADWIRSHLQIVAAKSTPSIYQLTFPIRDRKKGVEIVNGLMVQFQQYLEVQYQQFADMQLTYLSKRQHELFEQLDGALKEHATYLSRSLGEKGFMNLEQELKVYLNPYLKMVEKSLGIDLELQRLKEGAPLRDESPFAHSLKTLFLNIQSLEQERDLLEISLSQSLGNNAIETPHWELDQVREKKEKMESFLEKVRSPSSITSSFLDITFAPDPMIAAWAKRIQESEAALKERGDMVEYLTNSARLLSIREKILQGRFLHKGSIPPEFEGIDLKTSRRLFIDYNRRLDECEATIRHIDTLRGQMLEPSFEVSSLSGVLKDPIGQNLIAQASQISFQLKDQKNRTSKEGERWREDLDLKRNLLGGHLDQLYQMEKTNSVLIREKIGSLQQVSLDCINRQISVIQEQIEGAIIHRSADLLQEKKLLEEKMGEIRTHLVELPQKWHMDNLLQLKSKMSNQMMQAVVGLVESKTIGHQMHRIESKPLDFAIAPYSPTSPRLFLHVFFGAFLAGFGLFFRDLLRAIQRGFPMDSEKLKTLKFPFSGEISSICDGPAVESISGTDLEALREISLFAEASPQAKLLGVVVGKGPDYSFALAEVVARAGRTVCLLRCDFAENYREEDRPGLLQVLQGEVADFPFRQGKGFTYVSAGGCSPFGLELLRSPLFAEKMGALRSEYDLIILYFRSSLQTATAKAALGFCDKVVVTIRDEPIDLLTPFAAWAYHEGHCRLTFVASGIP